MHAAMPNAASGAEAGTPECLLPHRRHGATPPRQMKLIRFNLMCKAVLRHLGLRRRPPMARVNCMAPWLPTYAPALSPLPVVPGPAVLHGQPWWSTCSARCLSLSSTHESAPEAALPAACPGAEGSPPLALPDGACTRRPNLVSTCNTANVPVSSSPNSQFLGFKMLLQQTKMTRNSILVLVPIRQKSCAQCTKQGMPLWIYATVKPTFTAAHRQGLQDGIWIVGNYPYGNKYGDVKLLDKKPARFTLSIQKELQN